MIDSALTKSCGGVVGLDRTAMPNWGTISDVMAHLKVSRDTVRRMIARGDIPARRFGPRLIRVDMDLLDSSSKPVLPED